MNRRIPSSYVGAIVLVVWRSHLEWVAVPVSSAPIAGGYGRDAHKVLAGLLSATEDARDEFNALSREGWASASSNARRRSGTGITEMNAGHEHAMKRTWEL